MGSAIYNFVYKKEQAKKIINEILTTNFPWIYKRLNLNQDEFQLFIKMDSNVYHLRVSFQFQDEYLDVLSFVSPIILDENYYEDTVKIINVINTYSKLMGTWYVDYQTMDIAYSIRFPYEMIENLPSLTAWDISGCVRAWDDMFFVIVEVATGKKSYKESTKEIEHIWNKSLG